MIKFFFKIIKNIHNLFLYPETIKYFFTWKIFSFASYKITIAIKKLHIKPEYIIDVGANIGQFSYTASKILKPKKVILFEANNELKNHLQKNLSEFSNITIFSKALSSKIEIKEFNVFTDSQVSSFNKSGKDRNNFFPEDTSLKKVLKIETETLDNFIELNSKLVEDLSKTLLKLDVQGHEFEILKGCEKNITKFKWIILEISHDYLYENQASFDQVYKFLINNNFSFSRSLNYHYQPNNILIMETDMLFINNKI